MTPKEQALQLYKRHLEILQGADNGNISDEDIARNAAVFTVDIVIHELHKVGSYEMFNTIIGMPEGEFWTEVKNELQKL